MVCDVIVLCNILFEIQDGGHVIHIVSEVEAFPSISKFENVSNMQEGI